MILQRTKRTYTDIALIFLTVVVLSEAEAQNFEIGLYTGTGSSKAISHYDDENRRYKSLTSFGFHVGPTVHLTLGKRFALETAMLYNRKSYGYNIVQGHERLHFITVPLSLKWYIMNKRVRGFLGAGLYGAYLMNSRASVAGGAVPTTDAYQRSDGGLRVILGMDYPIDNIVLFGQINIDTGIADLSTDPTSYVTLQYTNISLGFRTSVRRSSGSKDQ